MLPDLLQAGQPPEFQVAQDLISDAFIVGRNDLTAIAEVHLVAIVGRRVVASGDHDASSTAESSNGMRHEGSGAESREYVHRDALGDTDCRADFSVPTLYNCPGFPQMTRWSALLAQHVKTCVEETIRCWQSCLPNVLFHLDSFCSVVCWGARAACAEVSTGSVEARLGFFRSHMAPSVYGRGYIITNTQDDPTHSAERSKSIHSSTQNFYMDMTGTGKHSITSKHYNTTLCINP
jgi:hypothetical protein